MAALDQQFRPHPEVVDTELEAGEGVLLHMETKTYYSLNPTGLRIWQGLKQGLTIGEIGHRFQDEFEVAPEHAVRSVEQLVDELSQQALVRSTS